MKTLKAIGATLSSLLAWACVLGVLFLGATNAHAQGFPVKPKFQDVRIGFNTFAECEAEFGAGQCDLTMENALYVQGGIATSNNVHTFDLNADGTLNGFNLNVVGGSWNVDLSGNLNETTDGQASITAEGGPLTLTAQGTSGDITLTTGDDFTVNATDLIEIGTGGGAYEFRAAFGDVILNASDDVTLNASDEIQINGTTNLRVATPTQLFTPTVLSIDANAGSVEFSVLDNSVQINAETTISSASGDVVLDAGDVAQISGATTLTLNSSAGSVVMDAGAGTDEITVGNNTVTVTGTVVLPTTTTISGQNLCRADGTNCPSTTAPVRVFKASATDRSSTTTLASDSDLTFTSAASATYSVKFCLTFGGVTTGTQGFKFAFNGTNAGTDPGMWGGTSRVNGSGTAHSGIAAGLGTGDTTGQISYATISVGNLQDVVCGEGVINTNGTRSYAIQWAQASSSANATRLGQGSFLEYTRIN